MSIWFTSQFECLGFVIDVLFITWWLADFLASNCFGLVGWFGLVWFVFLVVCAAKLQRE